MLLVESQNFSHPSPLSISLLFQLTWQFVKIGLKLCKCFVYSINILGVFWFVSDLDTASFNLHYKISVQYVSSIYLCMYFFVTLLIYQLID